MITVTISRFLLISFLIALPSVCPLLAQSLYQQSFDNLTAGNITESTTGWYSYQGSAATSITSETSLSFLSNLAGNPGSSYGYLALNTSSANNYALVQTGISFNASKSVIKWNMGNSNSATTVRLLLKIDDNWYASSTTFTTSPVISSAPLFAGATTSAVEKSLTFSTASSNWRNFTLNPSGSAMALGSVLTSDLPSSFVTGIGFYVSTAAGSSILRIDQLTVLSTIPAVVWAHYMPQVPNAHLHAHPHVGGNNDAWPFNQQSGDSATDLQQHMLQAIESGVSGFQMLGGVPSAAFTAANAILTATGTTFYLAPEWTSATLSSDPVIAANTVADYILQHANDPMAYQYAGEPCHFLYSATAWSETAAGMDAFNGQLRARGVSVRLIKKISQFDKIALDRPDLLNQLWPKPVQCGTLSWLLTVSCDAAHGFDRFWDRDACVALDQRLKSLASDFLWIPSIAAGYDSSNRPGQATRVPFHGIKNIIDTMHLWMALGYRQVLLVTWNDCNESLWVPSSRNVWGYNTLLKFFRGLMDNAKSPFPSPRIVVSYPNELLYGDTFYFQCAGLPATDKRCDVNVTVELRPVNGGTSVTLSNTISGNVNAESLLTLSWDTTSVVGVMDAVQPFVTIQVRETSGGNWNLLYNQLPLATTRLRYNLVKLPVPYSIDLSWITATQPTLTITNSSPVEQAQVTISSTESIKRLTLCEGSLSLGGFRSSTTLATLSNLFLRVEASENIPLMLSIGNGLIHDLYSPHYLSSITSVESVSAVFSSYPAGDYRTRVARFDCTTSSVIQLSLPDYPSITSLSTNLGDLQKRNVAKTVTINDRKVTLNLVLTSDTTDANLDYPLSGQGTYVRHVPLATDMEGLRVLQAITWYTSGKIAFSNPVIVQSSQTLATTSVPIQLIRAGGDMDDFVSPYSGVNLNTFTASQVITASLSRSRIPYFHLDFEEGAGFRLNDRGSSHQSGRAWVEYGGLGDGQTANYDQETNNHYAWVDGCRGKALQLINDGTVVRFRSKSSPVGAQTTSLWINVTIGNTSTPIWKQLNASPFTIQLNSSGVPILTLQRAGLSASLQANQALHTGWNHLVCVYDLTSLKLYLDGILIGQSSGLAPVYQRTHQTPGISFSTATTSGVLGFIGTMDEVEVIGAAISADEVSRLTQGNNWR